MLIRAQEMSRYVEHGVLDCGLTGKDWVMKRAGGGHRCRTDLCQAEHGQGPLVLAVPKTQVSESRRPCGKDHRYGTCQCDQKLLFRPQCPVKR